MIELNKAKGDGVTYQVNPDNITYCMPMRDASGSHHTEIRFNVLCTPNDPDYIFVNETPAEIWEKVFKWERLKRGI